MSVFRELPDWARRRPPPGYHDVPEVRREIQRIFPEADILFNCLVRKWEVFYRTHRGAWAEYLLVHDAEKKYMEPDQRVVDTIGSCLVDSSGFSSPQKAWDVRMREERERAKERLARKKQRGLEDISYSLNETARAATNLESAIHT